MFFFTLIVLSVSNCDDGYPKESQPTVRKDSLSTTAELQARILKPDVEWLKNQPNVVYRSGQYTTPGWYWKIPDSARYIAYDRDIVSIEMIRDLLDTTERLSANPLPFLQTASHRSFQAVVEYVLGEDEP